MTVLNIQEIEKIIPHRYPFLLVDKVIDLVPGKKITAIKNVTMNEHFFQGHFPGQPIMPGVLILEALAQAGAIMALREPRFEGKIVYFAGIDNVRFRRPVVPGDQIKLEAEFLWIKSSIGKVKALATVEGEEAAAGEFMFSLVDKGKIHPTAVIHPSAQIGNKVEIGAYTVIGPEVIIGDETKIGPHCVIHKWTKIGRNNKILQGVSIAAPPQDIKYKNEKNSVEIGDNNLIREFVTIHLPTGENNTTKIGSDNFIMVHAHIPHNCSIGNQCIIGGYVGLGGHTVIDNQVIIGGLAGIHQFCRIGRLAMIGAQSKVTQDVPPFMLVEGNPAQIRTINSVGLARRNVSQEAQTEIKKAFKIIYGGKKSIQDSLKEIRGLRPLEEIKTIIKFLEQDSGRGINKKISGEDLKELEEELLLIPDLPEIGL